MPADLPPNITRLPVAPRPTAFIRPDQVFVEHAGVRTAFASPEHLGEVIAEARAAREARADAAAASQRAADDAAAEGRAALRRAAFTRARPLARLHWALSADMGGLTGAVAVAAMVAPAAVALTLRLAGALS